MPTYPTIEDTIGNTPLVRLQRIPGTEQVRPGSLILAKLEGNNPAGSVKDRPAMSMIRHAEARGQIRPGDTLIEATSGNTGIALAMAAAIRGYHMVLIMPENLSVERRQTMRAFGAEIILTPKTGGMEYARDLADQMQRDGKGLVLDQFANPDNPVAHYESTGPEIWRDTEGRVTHFVSSMGTTGTINGTSRLPQGTEPGDPGRRVPADRGQQHPGHPQMGARISAQDPRTATRRPHGVRRAIRCRNHGAADGGRGGHLRRHFLGRGFVRGLAHRTRSRQRHHRLHRLRSRRSVFVDRRVSGLSR